MYQQMRDNLRIEVSAMSSDDVISEASTIIVKLLRLSQIASNPALLDPSYSGSNAKLKELEDLLEDILEDDTKKVIVWSHYVQNVQLLTEMFSEKYFAVCHTGEQSLEARQKSVQLFTEDPNCRLFIATPQSAKEGLTLLPKDGKTRADTMIYTDLSFDGGSYLQSQARFHRIGQNAERCLVIHLLAEDTVDEYIRTNIVEKIETAGALLDDKEVSKKVASTELSREVVLRLLG
jgi:SNF2 family DNA or RNA helicase